MMNKAMARNLFIKIYSFLSRIYPFVDDFTIKNLMEFFCYFPASFHNLIGFVLAIQKNAKPTPYFFGKATPTN